MKSAYFTSLCVVIFITVSCSINTEYKAAMSSNNESALVSFLQKHPKSKYETAVILQLLKLKDEAAWNSASLFNTEESYLSYLKNFPSGQFIKQAHQKISELLKQKELAQKQIEDLAWNKAQSEGTIESYKKYILMYPNGRFLKIAEANVIWLKEKDISKTISFAPIYNREQPGKTDLQIDSNDQRDWDQASKLNTINSYKGYLKKYPRGIYKEEAEKRIIDKEVAAIIAGKHGKLPVPQRSGSDYSAGTSVVIRITNNTKYTLTVLYSGPVSRKLDMASNGSESVDLAPGSYSIAAKVNDPEILPFAGTHSLKAGDYDETFYIRTSNSVKYYERY